MNNWYVVEGAAKASHEIDIEDIRRPSAVQVGGDHYKNFVIQPAEFITRNNLGFLEGNVIKYVCRHEHKDGVRDIDKAIHYLQLLKEYKYS